MAKRQVVSQLERACEIARSLKYKEWRFFPYLQEGVAYVGAECNVDDVYGTDAEVTLGGWSDVSAGEPDSRVIRRLFNCIIDMEVHEAGEHFMYGSERPFDPHNHTG